MVILEAGCKNSRSGLTPTLLPHPHVTPENVSSKPIATATMPAASAHALPTMVDSSPFGTLNPDEFFLLKVTLA